MSPAGRADAGAEPSDRAGVPDREKADLLVDAALYEAIYPQRAALIRRYGGVPHDADFGAPEDDLVRVLLTIPPGTGSVSGA